MSKRLMVGYQLYSARGEAAADLEGTLHALADMGYEGVEFAGFYGHTAKEIAKLLRKADLKPAGSHVPLERIREDMHGVLNFHIDAGFQHIAVPSLGADELPGAAGFADVLRTLYVFGRLCKKNGVTLSFHNHDAELAPFCGTTGLDFMLAAVPDTLLMLEPDVCWLRYAGADPADMLRRYARRCPLIHLHDHMPTDDAQAPIKFMPVGMGVQDVPGIIAAAKEGHAKWLIVEQDESTDRPPLEDAKLSAKYVLEQGL